MASDDPPPGDQLDDAGDSRRLDSRELRSLAMQLLADARDLVAEECLPDAASPRGRCSPVAAIATAWGVPRADGGLHVAGADVLDLALAALAAVVDEPLAAWSAGRNLTRAEMLAAFDRALAWAAYSAPARPHDRSMTVR